MHYSPEFISSDDLSSSVVRGGRVISLPFGISCQQESVRYEYAVVRALRRGRRASTRAARNLSTVFMGEER